ncbi:hypothetical protein FF098_006830 [Parvularcula flava]|uniref:SF3 helicase domain-containing protein n=1 Tax=Aquisalinus luteolus TaxID=1566827 RepID=A0ABX0HHP4_9PROT|nr:hypothetical protein [Aquisalinus luteolus]
MMIDRFKREGAKVEKALRMAGVMPANGREYSDYQVQNRASLIRASQVLRKAGIRPGCAEGFTSDQLHDYRQIARDRGCDPDILHLPKDSEPWLANEFISRHPDLLFINEWNSWLIWTGQVWERDRSLRIKALFGDLLNEIAIDFFTGERRIMTKITSAATRVAVERIARADRRVAMLPGQLDANPWVLNTPGGIINLRNGEMACHTQDQHQTRITSHGPARGKTDCPLWRRALDEWSGGDAELVAYLQRVAGYVLTGSTEEHALFFIYGSGANGKSTFINTLARILHDYAIATPAEIFMAGHGERHPTDLARLQGARLVMASEIREGSQWDTGRLQQITGGDRLSARFMRCDPFDFYPQCKLIFSGNHRPELGTINQAIRRRMHLIPFNATIPNASRDRQFESKLMAEAPAILDWIIEGCRAWQAGGLQPPDAVKRASTDYLERSSPVMSWISDRCAREPNVRVSRAALWSDWRKWATANGEREGSARQLYERLEAAGFEPFKSNGERGFKGLRLNYQRQSKPI